MRRFLTVILAASTLALAGCSGAAKVGDKTYSAYGLVNKDDLQNPGVHYHVSVWNCVLAVVFVETIVVPAVVVGWQLWIPDGTSASHADPSTRGVEA